MPDCRRADRPRAVQRLLREDAGEERADRAAESVRGHDVERIVERRPGPPEQAEVAGNRRNAAKRDSAHRSDESGGRGDGDQADHDGGRGADRGRLAVRA